MTNNLITTKETNWGKIHKDIFGEIIPKCFEWTNIDDIIKVLNKVGSIQHSNSIFLPGGGDLELIEASQYDRKGWLELDLKIQTWITKPKALIFESIDDTLERNYFRLETETVSPSGVYENLSEDSTDELLCELEPLIYIDQSFIQLGEYKGEPLPDSSRLITRCFNGTFVIFDKLSIYNDIGTGINVLHDKLNAIEFRQHIEKCNLV